jgi:hypothetical protein
MVSRVLRDPCTALSNTLVSEATAASACPPACVRGRLADQPRDRANEGSCRPLPAWLSRLIHNKKPTARGTGGTEPRSTARKGARMPRGSPNPSPAGVARPKHMLDDQIISYAFSPWSAASKPVSSSCLVTFTGVILLITHSMT